MCFILLTFQTHTSRDISKCWYHNLLQVAHTAKKFIINTSHLQQHNSDQCSIWNRFFMFPTCSQHGNRNLYNKKTTAAVCLTLNHRDGKKCCLTFLTLNMPRIYIGWIKMLQEIEVLCKTGKGYGRKCSHLLNEMLRTITNRCLYFANLVIVLLYGIFILKTK